MASIVTFSLPSKVPALALRGKTVVVADVLRATTSIVAAFDAGVRQVIPVQSIAEARERAARTDDSLLAGERDCLTIDGFDFGNSPIAIRNSTLLRGKQLILTTTNGTRALLHCWKAKRVLIGAFANLSAVARSVQAGDLVLLSAGTNGVATEEDDLFTAALADRVAKQDGLPDASLAPSLVDAMGRWRMIQGDTRKAPISSFGAQGMSTAAFERLEHALRDSRGGRNLIATGQGDDIREAARMDVTLVVPEFSADDLTIRRSNTAPKPQ